MDLSSIMMITWAGFGLKIEREQEGTDGLVVYVSVPEHSYQHNASGSEMAGMALAKRFKESIEAMGVKSLTVKTRVRDGEMWTWEMQEEAESIRKRQLFNNNLNERGMGEQTPECRRI